MAFRLTHDITINDQPIRFFYSLQINKDINRLTDTGKITIPAHDHNMDFSKRNIKRGDPINISVGYDDDNRHEFAGFVSFVQEVYDKFTIEFEDFSFALRQSLTPHQWIPEADYNALSAEQKVNASPGPARVRDILDYILANNDSFNNGDFVINSEIYPPQFPEVRNVIIDWEWSSFTIGQGDTAYTVISDMKDKKLGLFHFFSTSPSGEPLRKPELRIGTFYLNQERVGTSTAKFDLGENVFSVSNLRHVWAERSGVQVTVTSKNPGTGESEESDPSESEDFAQAPSQQIIRFDGAGSGVQKVELNDIAGRIRNSYSYTGLKGSFRAKLLPYCNIGYRISIDDPLHPRLPAGDRTYENSFGGDYICNTIDLTVDRNNGSRRQVGVGQRLYTQLGNA